MSRYQRLFAVALFAIALLGVLHVTGVRAHFDLNQLHQHFVDNMATGLLIYIALFALGNLAHVPGWIFLAAAVLAMGQVWGALVTYLAASISCVITFVLIRHMGGDALRGLGGKRVAWLFSQMDAHPIRSVALLRMLLQTLPALNYALALSGVKFRHYLLGTLIGLPIPILLYTVFVDVIAMMLNISRH